MWNWRYKLAAQPRPTADGSGAVLHEIWGEGSLDGGEWLDTGVHRDMVVPASELTAALASGTNAQKVVAYKSALASNLHTQVVPVGDLTPALMQQRMEANIASVAAADEANAFITVTLNKTYPVTFAL